MPGRVSLTFIDRAGTYIPPPTEAQPGSTLDQLLTKLGIKFLPLVLAVLSNISHVASYVLPATLYPPTMC